MTIWKFHVPITDDALVSMPQGATILTVQMQQGEPYIWALVDPDQPMVPHEFAWRGTGHPADTLAASQYVGSVQMHGGALVFHLFDRG